MKQGRTGLTLRELQVYRKPTVELTPKQINLWVEQLPVANLGESSQRVYRLLVDANQTILEADLRLSLLNIIEPVVHNLIDSLERQFINNHISLTDKQKKIAALVQAIQTELSIGYHTVIESIVIDGVKNAKKKILAKSIALAIKYHGLVILRCYQLYASVPGRIWREIYLLYQLSRDHQINTKEFKLTRDKSIYSPKIYFVRVLLLAIANPYQLRQGEIELLWTILPDYFEQATLESHAFTNHHFLINLNSNKPPVQKSLYKKQVDENCLKISVSSIIEKLKSDLSQVEETARYSARRAMVYKHLIHCWSFGIQRSFARTNCNDKIQVSIGLGATHYLLMEHTMKRHSLEDDEHLDNSLNSPQTLDAMEGSLKNVTLASVASKKQQFEASSNKHYLSTSAITSKDVWAKLYSQNPVLSNTEKESAVTKRSRDTIVRDSYKIQNCDLINMSPGGYCLQIPSAEIPKHAQTGEIIGFIEGEEDSQHWSIGVVRWVRRRIKGHNIQMGVQLLAPDAVPIGVQLRNSRNRQNSQQRALLLPALTVVGQSATIITNPLAFSLNNKIRVNEISKEYEVRLTKEISASGSSRQFSFEKLTINKEEEPPPNSIQERDQDNIDGIWDLI